FEPRLRRARQRLEAMEAEARTAAERAAQEETVEAVVGQLDEFARRVTEGLEGASWATKREGLRALVQRVQVGAEEGPGVSKVDPWSFADGPVGGRLQDRLGRDATPIPGRLPPPPAPRRPSQPFATARVGQPGPGLPALVAREFQRRRRQRVQLPIGGRIRR